MNTKTPLDTACSVCLAPGDSVNHLDHLAVIAYILDIPLVTDEELLVETMATYYPQVKPLYIQKHAQILEFLATRYDALFVSSANYRKDLSPLLEILFRKQLQFWYCPHGNSDKPMKQFGMQETTLIYGNQMEERLKQADILPTLKGYVKTGNYRLSFYQKYGSFYDGLVEKEVFSHFKKRQTTLLYAPTWHDLESSSSLFEVGKLLLNSLPDHYNLIVKLHPWLDHHHSGIVHLLKEQYGDKPNIVILTLYPLVLPILNRTDAYLGDFSSIGYDFLFFNRPMFFFDPKTRKDKMCAESSYVHSCGQVMTEKDYPHIYDHIARGMADPSPFKAAQKSLYRYAFGEPRSFGSLKQDIQAQIAALKKTSSD